MMGSTWFLGGWLCLFLCVSPSLTDTAGLNNAVDRLLDEVNNELAGTNLTVGSICEGLKMRLVYIFRTPGKINCSSSGVVKLGRLLRHGEVSRPNQTSASDSEVFALEVRAVADSIQLQYDRCEVSVAWLHWRHALPLACTAPGPVLRLRLLVTTGSLFSPCSARLADLSLDPLPGVTAISGDRFDFTSRLQAPVLAKLNTEVREALGKRLASALQSLLPASNLCQQV